jgi:MprA protease rhombosortase-interaction domain-containing protein
MMGIPPSRNFYRPRRPLSPWPRRVALAVFVALAVACVLLLGGCMRPGRSQIKTPDFTVLSPPNPGTPATLNTANEGEDLEIPAGSVATVTETAAVEAQPATTGAPAVEARPATKETVITFSATSHWKRTRATVKADTGTVDTSVAKHAIDVESRRPMLYAAMVAVVGGLGFMYVRFQAIAVMCFLAAGAFFLAWKMSEISPWLGGVLLAAGIAGFAFYKRAEWDKNGDGIPDVLQSKKPNPEQKASPQ